VEDLDGADRTDPDNVGLVLWTASLGLTIEDIQEDTRRFIRQMLLKLADRKEYGFGLLYRGTLVGAICLDVDEKAIEAEVGYWLSEGAQGWGIVSRATQALVRFSFVDLGVNVVVIKCARDNVRSRAVPERLGFTLEATLREREVAGQDQIVYSLLRSEWQASER
jgi:ribosomal-protein-serine acetyltransferase